MATLLAWVQQAQFAVLVWVFAALHVGAFALFKASPMLQLTPFSSNSPSAAFTALPPSIAFVHTGHLSDVQILCTLQAQLSNPNTDITIILDKDSDLEPWQAVAEGTNLQLYRPQKWDAVDRFMSIYRHASITQLEKEAFGIYQHLLVLDYMISHNKTSLLHLELDIGVFGDVSKAVPPDAAVAGLHAFATHWTQTSLTAFADFIWKFYKQADHDLAKSIVRWGVADLNGALATNPSVVNWWPAGTPMCLMNAMRLILTFQRTSGVLRLLCASPQELHCPDGLQLLSNLDVLQSKPAPLDHNGQATSIQQLYQLLFWRQDPAAGWQPWTKQEHRDSLVLATVVPGLHLQFPAKPIVQHMLCDNILRHSDNSAAEDICFPRVAYSKAALDHLWIESMIGV